MTDMDEGYAPLSGDSGRDDATVIRSAEELQVSTRRRAAQRARLVKHVETETRTVQVRHEQVRVEYEPIRGDAPDSASATTPAGGERWLVLYDEEVTVQTRWIPRERVRLGIVSVIEDWEISEDLRSERIEVDDTTHGG